MTILLDIKHFVTNLNLNSVFKAKSSCSSFSASNFLRLFCLKFPGLLKIRISVLALVLSEYLKMQPSSI
jgi:hypothetical protein